MNTLYRPFLVAITGGIASGKSSFCKLLEENNQTVYYADKIAHDSINTPESQMLITKLLGEGLIENGIVNRKKVANIVFNNPAALKILNSIIHPAVRQQMQTIINNFKGKYLFFEIPLLFEGNLHKSFDLNVLVSAKTEIRIERAIKNRGYSKAEAEARISSQMPEQKKLPFADYVVYNNGNLDTLKISFNMFLAEIENYKFKQVKPLVG